MFSGIDNLTEKVVDGERIVDTENRLPKLKVLTTNDVQISLLKKTATIPEIIVVLNELIKRDVIRNKV